MPCDTVLSPSGGRRRLPPCYPDRARPAPRRREIPDLPASSESVPPRTVVPDGREARGRLAARDLGAEHPLRSCAATAREVQARASPVPELRSVRRRCDTNWPPPDSSYPWPRATSAESRRRSEAVDRMLSAPQPTLWLAVPRERSPLRHRRLHWHEARPTRRLTERKPRLTFAVAWAMWALIS